MAVVTSVPHNSHHLTRSTAHNAGQSDPFLAWIYMGIYWFGGACLNFRTLRQLLDIANTTHHWTTYYHGLALLVTIECQRQLNRRYDAKGREPDVLVCWVFAISNGIFETLWFLAVYDFGRVVLGTALTLSTIWAIGLGWTLYYVYSAVIHVAFWLPHVFPNHTKASAPPFHLHGLPLLTVISVPWFIIYEQYHDVGFICFLHAIMDGWVAWNIGLPGPYAKKGLIGESKMT
jgi:hypothetical protein